MTTRIIGTGSYLPERIVSNDDLSKLVDTNDEWIYSRTGIHDRRIADNEDTSSVATKAAMAAIHDSGMKASEIELIIVATSTPDYAFPNTASIVQAELGAEHAVCFDVSAACTGFLIGLETAHAFLMSGIYKNALVIGAEVMSKMLDWTDRSTCVLFGDGAGAVVVVQDSSGIEQIVMHNNGEKNRVLNCQNRGLTDLEYPAAQKGNAYIQMDGQEVFKFAVKKVPECIMEVLNQSQTDISEVKYFILHQANVRIIQAVAKKLNVNMEKFPANLNKYGNTSAASIPILLKEMSQKQLLKPGDQILLSGFGAGLSWGAILLTW